MLFLTGILTFCSYVLPVPAKVFYRFVMWLSVALLQVLPTYHQRPTPKRKKWVQLMDGCFQTLHPSSCHSVLRSNGGGKKNLHQFNLLSLNKSLMMDRKRQRYCCVSTLRQRLFCNSQSSCQRDAADSEKQTFTKLASKSALWVCVREYERVCVFYRLIPINETRSSIQRSVWLAGIVSFPSNEQPSR